MNPNQAIELSDEPTKLIIRMREQINDLDRSPITPAVYKFYANQATEIKKKIDQLAAETQQRQDKVNELNKLICAINKFTDEKNELDLNKLNPGDKRELQEKLRMAKELGADINVDRLKFNSNDRDRLIRNLDIKADEWNKDNRTQTQKLDICAKELDRILLMLKDINKGEDRSKRGATSGIK